MLEDFKLGILNRVEASIHVEHTSVKLLKIIILKSVLSYIKTTPQNKMKVLRLIPDSLNI